MIKFTVIPKKVIWHLEIWQNWCIGQFYHSKIEKETLSLTQFSLVAVFFEGMRENILHIFQAYYFTRGLLLIRNYYFPTLRSLIHK